MTRPPVLEVANLSKTFTLHLLGAREIAALNDVSFPLAEGEFLALTGRTGAGKSTLIKTLLHYNRPTGGSVRYRRADGTVLTLADLPVIDLLADLKTAGISTIAVLHDRVAVDRLADREIEINDGRIVAETPVRRKEEAVL